MVARGGAQLPTFAEFQHACVVAKELTVRDVWGLMLTAIDGAMLCCFQLLILYTSVSKKSTVSQTSGSLLLFSTPFFMVYQP